MNSHPRVKHPNELLVKAGGRIRGLNEKILEWCANNLGASVVTFWIALVAPLAVLPMSSGAKLLLAVISGSWFQWWMLPAIQRSGIKADAKREAKASADHEALTHIANTVDEIRKHVDKGIT
jgi:hypothetical protein